LAISLSSVQQGLCSSAGIGGAQGLDLADHDQVIACGMLGVNRAIEPVQAVSDHRVSL